MAGMTPAFRRWFPVAAGVLFALAYTQPPLYYSNQNQYFLHGAARAGRGDLRASDWLSATADPTPVFSTGVMLAEGTGVGPWPVFAAFGLLCAVYFASLWALVGCSPLAPRTRGGCVLWAGVLTALHSGAARAVSVHALGADYPWYAQAGVANQYLLGAGLQPSAFGVCLLAGVAAYAADRLTLSAVLIVGACAAHSTYLLPAALVVVGVLAVEMPARRVRPAVRFALGTLAGVLPVVALTAILFDPFGDPVSVSESQRILAAERLPHHCAPGRFFDWCAWVQVAWVAGGLWLARGTAWGRVLAVASGFSASLTLLQLATGHAGLALLFPWRLSAVLVPVATALVCAVVVRGCERLPSGAVTAAGGALLAFAVAGAAVVSARGLGYQDNPAEAGVQRFVAAARTPGDVYLLPTKVPVQPYKLRIGSASFVPVAPVSKPFFELQSFRLTTGAAAYVDFKSIPYAPRDVLEWRRRVAQCEAWYAAPDWDAGTLGEVRAAGVTHVLAPEGMPLKSRNLREVYADDSYRVYALTPPGD